MGYSTDFMGALTIEPPLKAEHRAYLEALATTRRMARKVTITRTFPDPIREAAGLPLGEEGEFFVGDMGAFGQSHTPDIKDYNRPPATQPGLWLQWTPNADGTEYEWDGGEKFYEYDAWMRYVIRKLFAPWGYTLNGEIEWQGEDSGDIGCIRVTDNVVQIGHGERTYIFGEEAPTE